MLGAREQGNAVLLLHSLSDGVFHIHVLPVRKDVKSVSWIKGWKMKSNLVVG